MSIGSHSSAWQEGQEEEIVLVSRPGFETLVEDTRPVADSLILTTRPEPRAVKDPRINDSLVIPQSTLRLRPKPKQRLSIMDDRFIRSFDPETTAIGLTGLIFAGVFFIIRAAI